jgi:hypothetical protein
VSSTPDPLHDRRPHRQDGATGRPFRFRIRDSGRGESIVFLRNSDEVKSASYERFVRFFAAWRSGCHTPDDYRNGGREQSKAQV